MLSAVTIMLFATVIAVSAKDRPHTFRDQAASETVNEQTLNKQIEYIGQNGEKRHQVGRF